MRSVTSEVEATYVGAVSDALDTTGLTRGRFSAAPIAGELTSAVFTIQHSVNGVDYFDGSETVTASALSTELDLEGIASVRARVSTASSASATARITIYAEGA